MIEATAFDGDHRTMRLLRNHPLNSTLMSRRRGPRSPLSSPCALIAILAALPIAGCGGSESSQNLTPSDAADLIGRLSEIESDAAAERCEEGAFGAADLRVTITDPSLQIGRDLRDALVGSVDLLETRITEQCGQIGRAHV